MKKKLFVLGLALVLAMSVSLFALTACNRNQTHECNFGNWVVTTAATCTVDGVETRTCQNENCDKYETRPIAATGHSFSDWAVYTAPTCTQAGVEHRVCSSCNTAETRAGAAATGHTWGGDVITAPTCTQDGFTTQTCSVSQTTRQINIVPATGHGEFVWKVITPATATQDGLQGYACEHCATPKPQGTTKPITAGLTFEPIGSPATAYRLTGGALSATAIYIPSTHNGLPVTHISAAAFRDRANITSAFFPYSIVATEGSAFDGSFRNSGLTSVVFGANSNLTTLGGNAFRETNLTSIAIPSNVELIGNTSFQETNLTSIVIPASVTRIGNSAFRDSTLETLIVEEGSQLNNIGGNAFTDSNLTTIVIPLSMTATAYPQNITAGNNIGQSVFGELEGILSTVFFGGADTAAWQNVTIHGVGNDALIDATRYYFSSTAPTASGNFWRWVDGVPTPWTTAGLTLIDLSRVPTAQEIADYAAFWTFTNGVFTISDGANVRVTGTSTDNQRITIAFYAVVHMTLDNATIALDATVSGIPINVSRGATLYLTLVGNNVLTGSNANLNGAAIAVAGAVAAANGGQTVPGNLIIDGDGSLIATAGGNAAAIGGRGVTSTTNLLRTAGYITINGGTITALGSGRGAGIGTGGFQGTGGGATAIPTASGRFFGLTINGGTIYARAGQEANYAHDIGLGANHNAVLGFINTIYISTNATVNAYNGRIVGDVAPTGITIAGDATRTFTTLGAVQLEENRQPANATGTTTWTTSNPEVATVSQGLVTLVGLGTATITANLGGHTATVVFTVNAAPVPPGA